MENRRLDPPRLVAVDVDGTLLGQNRSVLDSDRAVLERARARGTVIVIQTARPFRSALHIAASAAGAYVIASNGGAVAEVATRQPVWVHDGLTDDEVAAIVGLAGKYELGLCLHGLDNWYQLNADGLVERLARRYRAAPLPIPPGGVCRGVLLAEFIGDEAALVAVRSELPSAVVATGSRDEPGLSLDVVPTGINKAVGLARLLWHLGLDWPDVLVVGDGENDMPAAKQARFSVAVKGAYEPLKDCVTHWVDLAPEDGAVGVSVAGLVLGDPDAMSAIHTRT